MNTTSSQMIRPQVRVIDGLSVRYAENEPRDIHALLLSPWPESIYCYEPTWWNLGDEADQAALCGFVSMTSIPSRNLAPAMSFGN